jgi:hypothetical protein
MATSRTELRAGPLELALVGPDLRYVSYRGEEIVRRVYMAVRDLDWETIPAVEHERAVDVGEDSFAVRMRLTNEGSGIYLGWDLEIVRLRENWPQRPPPAGRGVRQALDR